MKSKINKISFTALAFLLFAQPVFAQGFVFCGKRSQDDPNTPVVEGACTLNDLWTLIFYGANFLIGMSGLVALFFVVWGGVRMMLSFGNPEAVKEGKSTITNALLGLVLVLLSYLIVGYVAELLLPGGGVGNPLQNLIRYVRPN